jgi:hypothetical protein
MFIKNQLFLKKIMKVLILLILLSFSVQAVPPPRGIDPVEAKRQERKAKIEREKARRDSIWCYIKERKKKMKMEDLIAFTNVQLRRIRTGLKIIM